MNELLTLLLATVAGAGLGAMFFGGLWWTVRRSVASPRPALWFFGSWWLRMSAGLAGLYFVSSGHWQRLLACLLGFVMVRVAVIWLTRRSGNSPSRPAQEIRHAP